MLFPKPSAFEQTDEEGLGRSQPSSELQGCEKPPMGASPLCWADLGWDPPQCSCGVVCSHTLPSLTPLGGRWLGKKRGLGDPSLAQDVKSSLVRAFPPCQADLSWRGYWQASSGVHFPSLTPALPLHPFGGGQFGNEQGYDNPSLA